MTEFAIVVLTGAGLTTARTLAAALPGARIHALRGRAAGDVIFTDAMAHLQALFAAGTPLLGVCAAGILIRAVAPLLTDKRREPPVLAVAVDGSAVVPLLGGHHGANRLAQAAAAALGIAPTLTTAGELINGVALDDPPPGWTVGNPEAVKPLAAALLAGDTVRLEPEDAAAPWLDGLPFGDDGELAIRITDHAVMAEDGELLLHPQVLTLGVGCERGLPAAALIAHAESVLAAEGLAAASVACVASVDVKADEAAVHALAAHLGVPARFFTPAALEDLTPRLATPSAVVFAEVGCHGVAEGAALAAAGPAASLIVPKVKGARCTAAIARAPAPIDPETVGRARGTLFVVGIGPGRADWRIPAASRAIALSDDLVGYQLYLDLLGSAAAGKRLHNSALGAEIDRARTALDLAAQGRTVSLVCSGDAGIYALATLVFELLETENRADWNRLEIQVVPGVSALQAAAARAGAPVNHDFCTISLSDLLTPWPAIEKRLRGAAAGDFVVCFYNPVSQRRRDQIEKARDILLQGRPATTPVILARQLGRPEESVRVITLGELTADQCDMLTMVVVGSSETRSFAAGQARWTYTPRGYGQKMEKAQ